MVSVCGYYELRFGFGLGPERQTAIPHYSVAVACETMEAPRTDDFRLANGIVRKRAGRHMAI
jgi:hypothetical protein